MQQKSRQGSYRGGKAKGRSDSRTLKTKANLFNPVSEFGLGVQVVKLNKQIQLLKNNQSKKAGLKKQIY